MRGGGEGEGGGGGVRGEGVEEEGLHITPDKRVGIHIVFFLFLHKKHMLWVLIRSALPRSAF